VVIVRLVKQASFFTAFGKKDMLRRILNLFIGLSVFLLFPSCMDTRKLIYFNDAKESIYSGATSSTEAAIQKNDLLSITVNSLNPEASALFNAPNISASGINTSTAMGNSTPVGYLVNQEGLIAFPMLGEIKVTGMNKTQLAAYLTTQLKEKKLLSDPIVSIRFLNFRVSVLGEVAKPGVYSVPNEKLSLLEALGLAGDITIYGKRENVLVIREDDNARKVLKKVNLNSKEIFESPYYYLRSNDVVYVEPSQNRVQRERNQFLFPIIISMMSLGIIVIDRL
jgi:polysaccharide export outer membrane protein